MCNIKIKPDATTNYRYYKDSQLYYLDMIKSLKFIGTSLDEIKAAQQFTPPELLAFLQKQEEVIEQRINQLYDIQQTLFKTKKQMEEQLAIDIMDQVYIKNEDSARILSIKTKELHPDKDAAKCHNNNLSGLILLCFDYS